MKRQNTDCFRRWAIAWNPVSAESLLPSVMMFFALQRHFVARLTFGATKCEGDDLFVQPRVDLNHDVVRYEFLQVSRRMISISEHVEVVSMGGDIRRA